MTFKFGSLFAGIGGVDLGLERAGMECAWQVEINPFCQKVLQKHWPNVQRYGDVREIGAINLESVDLIAGGFPCQPHSVYGKRKGSEDDRDLWPEFYRIICEIKPKWILAENVPGLLSSESGRFFGRILRDLASSGYDAEWQCIPAAAFGAPHIRERIYIIAYLRRKRDADGLCQVIPNPNSKRRGKQYTSAIPDGPKIFNRSHEADGGFWTAEPGVGRVADGISSRVDRLRGLGNAVVPQIAEWIGKRILESDAPTSSLSGGMSS